MLERYWDHVEDSLSSKMDHSHFAGGSQVLQRGFLPRHAALRASLACLLLAAGVGLLLQMGYKTGPLTIPLGVVGMIAGSFILQSRFVGCREGGVSCG